MLEGARLREYRLGDHGHIVFSYKRLENKINVRAHYEVKTSSEHAIYVSYFLLTSSHKHFCTPL